MLAKKIALGFGIAVLLPMMVYYGASTFIPKPKWEDYRIENYEERYEDAKPLQKALLKKEYDEAVDKWRKDRDLFHKYLFFIAASIGILVIIIGLIIKIQAIGAGLMFGGIFTLVFGYVSYWAGLQDWLRFMSLFVAFVILVVFGVIRFSSKMKNDK